ncbi:MAG: sel1 repeat family protein, partial [Planctomycetaceae bacterium]|nr:sel1 repeat family protein [Planctomycetaceae bacterium]
AQWFRTAAEQGNADAQYCYGWCLANGNGTSHDKQAAVKLFQQAAEQGDVVAIVEIGDCYSTGGFGILQNCEEAVKWYREAANKGNTEAEYKLAVCYLNGNGISKDKEKAIKLFRKAAEQKNEDAVNVLRELDVK